MDAPRPLWSPSHWLSSRTWRHGRPSTNHASESEQRQAWRSEAVTILGSPDAVDATIGAALQADQARLAVHGSRRLSSSKVHIAAKRVIQTVEADRATWQEWHCEPRPCGTSAPSSCDASWSTTPSNESCRRRSAGAFRSPTRTRFSNLEPHRTLFGDLTASRSAIEHRSTRYTSRRVMDAERRILEASRLTNGRRAAPTHVGLALLRAAAGGTCLTTAQEAMVRQMATSGNRLELALAPAGTGKTTALTALSTPGRPAADTSSGSPRPPSPHTSCAKPSNSPLRFAGSRGGGERHPQQARPLPATGQPAPGLGRRHRPRPWSWSTRPAWPAPRTRPRRRPTPSPGRQRPLIGDDRQLAAVQAGGVLRDIAHHRRRRHPHRGPPLHRPRRGRRDPRPARRRPLRARLLRRPQPHPRRRPRHRRRPGLRRLGRRPADGRDTILLAPTRDLVTELNDRARRDRLTPITGRSPPRPERSQGRRPSPTTPGLRRRPILTRRNDRTLRSARPTGSRTATAGSSNASTPTALSPFDGPSPQAPSSSPRTTITDRSARLTWMLPMWRSSPSARSRSKRPVERAFALSHSAPWG